MKVSHAQNPDSLFSIGVCTKDFCAPPPPTNLTILNTDFSGQNCKSCWYENQPVIFGTSFIKDFD